MNNKRWKPDVEGIPALVCVPTAETSIIKGKRYRTVKLMYDLEGEYMPPAKKLF